MAPCGGQNKDFRVTEDDKSTAKPKTGFFRRIFGRKETPEPEPEKVEIEPAAPAELVEEYLPAEAEPLKAEPETPSSEPALFEAPPIELPPIEPAAFEPVLPEPVSPEFVSPEFVLPEPEPISPEPVAFEPEPEAALPAPSAPPPRRSWWTRLRDGLSRSSTSIGTGLKEIFTKRKLDAAMLEDLEDVLIRADLGVATATRITEAVGKGRYDKDVDVDEVKAVLATEVERVLTPYAVPLALDLSKKPYVILVVGVNGSGKTTTIGKLAAQFSQQGLNVMLAAGDTFRAAAIEQLRIWGERLNCPVVTREQGSDAAGLAFDAIKSAREQGADILMMDTAGRLQNRAELMAELEKIIRVMKKLDPEAPHAVLLVLDATVGQNAISQVEIFGRIAGVTGLVMTKLDGTARGGILVAIAEKFRLPIHFIGVGEGADDLEAFAARDFARAIAGIEH